MFILTWIRRTIIYRNMKQWTCKLSCKLCTWEFGMANMKIITW